MQNDIAVAVAYALHVHGLQRVLVVDLDVHQGNGTAETFEHDDRVTTVRPEPVAPRRIVVADTLKIDRVILNCSMHWAMIVHLCVAPQHDLTESLHP